MFKQDKGNPAEDSEEEEDEDDVVDIPVIQAQPKGKSGNRRVSVC